MKRNTVTRIRGVCRDVSSQALRVFVVVAVTLCPFVYGSTEHSLEEKEAVELAYAALDSQRGAKAEDTELVHVARFNWPS